MVLYCFCIFLIFIDTVIMIFLLLFLSDLVVLVPTAAHA